LSELKKISFYVRNVTENIGATMLHHFISVITCFKIVFLLIAFIWCLKSR